MAAAASKFKIKRGTPKRGEIKIKIFKTIAKSLENLVTGVPGKRKIAGGNRVGSGGYCSLTATETHVELVGELKPSFKHEIKQNQPRRGQIKIKIFKLIAKSVQNLAVTVAGGKKKATGNEGGCGGCFSSPTTIVPVETAGWLLKPASGCEIKRIRPRIGEFEIKICNTIDESVIRFSESGGKKTTAAGRCFNSAAGIVPIEIVTEVESEKLCDYR